MVEYEQLKALYEELLKKIEEEDAVGHDKTSETANIAQTNVQQLRSECEQFENVQSPGRQNTMNQKKN